MHRVRIGLTGLAFVFLAVLLAAVFTPRATDELPITPNLIEQQGAAGTVVPVDPAPAEPLTELGVAPGKADSNAAAHAESAPPVDEQEQ